MRDPTALTIGVFDGVHRGHQRIFSLLLRIARDDGLIPLVLTFSPHPRKKSIEEEGGLLLSETERVKYINKSGIQEVSFLTFDRMLQRMSPEEFFRQNHSRAVSRSRRSRWFNSSFWSIREW